MPTVTKLIPLLLLCLTALAQTHWTYTVDTVAGHYPLGDGGPATEALLGFPEAARLDGQGNLYIADTGNLRVRRVDANGTITTVAELANRPHDLAVAPDGTVYVAADAGIWALAPDGQFTQIAGLGGWGAGGDGGPALDAQVGGAQSILRAPDGTLYFADVSTGVVRRFKPGGVIERVAGNGQSGYSGDGGPATEASLNGPSGLAFGPDGSLYIADRWNSRVRKVAPDGVITTVAGDGSFGCPAIGATAVATGLGSPASVIALPNGSLYVVSTGCSTLVQISAFGLISFTAGTNGFDGDGGPAVNAKFRRPGHLDITPTGQLHIADTGNLRIRRVGADMTINTVAGRSQFSGDGGPASQALLFEPADVVVDAQGSFLIADSSNFRIRKVDASGNITTIAGTGGAGFSGDDGPAMAANLNLPTTMGLGPTGTVYIANTARVRRFMPGGNITTLAGTGSVGNSGDGGPANQAQMGWVRGIAGDAAGNVYISDASHHVVRRVQAGTIQAFAGTGGNGFSGDGGPAAAAMLNQPGRLAIGSDGSVYIADPANQRIRKVAPDGAISTVAGNGDTGSPVDGEPALSQPLGPAAVIAVDSADNLYLSNGGLIWKIDGQGVIRLIAGSELGYGGDGGPALDAEFNFISGLAVAANGDVYVADRDNHRVRRLTPVPATNAALAGNASQNGLAGQPLGEGFRVQITAAGGQPLAGVAVTYQVLSGDLTLADTIAYTDASGVAVMNGVLDSGDATVQATAAGLPPVEFTVNAVTDPSGLNTIPTLGEGGVVGAGLSNPLVENVSPGGIVSLFGSGFAAAGTFRGLGEEDITDGKLPEALDGVCVYFGSQRGYMFHLFPGQINVQAPKVQPGQILAVQVARNCGTAEELRSSVELVRVEEAAPEFFYWAHPAAGGKPIAAVNPVAGTFIGAPAERPDMALVSAQPGDTLDLYATGLGAMNPPIEPGMVPDQLAKIVLETTITIDGAPLPPENILYVGVTQFAGVYILRIQLPDTLPTATTGLTRRQANRVTCRPGSSLFDLMLKGPGNRVHNAVGGCISLVTNMTP